MRYEIIVNVTARIQLSSDSEESATKLAEDMTSGVGFDISQIKDYHERGVKLEIIDDTEDYSVDEIFEVED